MQVLANRLDQIHFEVVSKSKALCFSNNCIVFSFYVYVSQHHLTDNVEIQDLRECLLAEQKEKNEFN
ncbi:hypothetical protein Ahy_A09g044075 [Arachis hypogaea]|uniref:Uncharacterized protein n=1 Tax=Arachis hypogaea TaxID=3818 RepID=A0A445BJJ5_ARAHY|nr:hypothetical protein Ahy_A09g044075 [Arachis hypogaea]